MTTEAEKRNGQEFLLIRSKGCVIPVRSRDLMWAKSDGDYVCLGSTEGTYFTRATLAEVKVRLGALPFIQIHRSTLVNLRFVKKLIPWFSGGYMAELVTGERFKVSKGYASRLFKRFGRI